MELNLLNLKIQAIREDYETIEELMLTNLEQAMLVAKQLADRITAIGDELIICERLNDNLVAIDNLQEKVIPVLLKAVREDGT